MHWWQWFYFIIAIALTGLSIAFLLSGIRYFNRKIRDPRKIYLCDYSECENKKIDDKYIEFIRWINESSKQEFKMHYECYKRYNENNDFKLEIIE